MEVSLDGVHKWQFVLWSCWELKKTQKKEKLGQTKEVSIGTRVQIRSSRPPLDTLC